MAASLFIVNRPTNNQPQQGYEMDILIKNMLHDARMEEVCDEDKDPFNDEEFEETIKRFSDKNKRCYDFLTKAGKNFQEATKILMKRIWETETIPEEWDFTLLIMLYKGRGLKESMDNNRFIH